MFSSHVFLFVFIYFYSLTRADSGTKCCVMESCSMDKIGISSQLMALALEIQTTTVKSSKNCGLLEPSTTSVPQTTITTTSELSSTYATEYTPEPSTTTETPGTTTILPNRYYWEIVGSTSLGAKEKCEVKGSSLLSIESRSELNQVWSYLKSKDGNWGPNNRLKYEYYWTSGKKMWTPEVWTWGDGTLIDQDLVSGIIVPAGQEASKNLLLRYDPAGEGQVQLTQWDGSATYHENIEVIGVEKWSIIFPFCENEPLSN